MKSLRAFLLCLFLCLCLSSLACDSAGLSEITIVTRTPQYIGQVYIGGAVNNPGVYPLAAEDTLTDLIQAAGGLKAGTDITQVKLSIPEVGQTSQPQRIDINRAEAWLLEALPGVGPVTAKNIIGYRQKEQFRSVDDLLKVPGIGPATLDKIKGLVTVSD